MRGSLLFLVLLIPLDLWSQPIQLSIRDINAIPEENIAFLESKGPNLTEVDVNANVSTSFSEDTVEVKVVVLTAPYNSGSAILWPGDLPSRIHVYVRDVSASEEGFAGMGMQLVDADYINTGLIDVAIGDVVQVTGKVEMFINSIRIVPLEIQSLGKYLELGYPESLLDPVDIQLDEIVKPVGDEDGVQTNWVNLPDLRNQFVRLTNVKINDRDLTNTNRPRFHITETNGEVVLPFYDSSLRFRNDQDDYPQPFNKRTLEEGDFIPPDRGARVNIQGFLTLKSFSDVLDRAVPANGLIDIIPFEDRGCDGVSAQLSCDFLVLDDELPVELTSFTGLISDENVYLRWETASEVHNAGFEIERSLNAEAFVKVGFVSGNGATNDPQRYFFVDEQSSKHGSTLEYRLKQIDFDGSFSYSAVISIEGGLIMNALLHTNFPNPFNPTTTISFVLPANGPVKLAIFDVLGRPIRTLIDGELESGLHEVVWDGLKYDRSHASSGSYLYRLETLNQVFSKPMVLLR